MLSSPMESIPDMEEGTRNWLDLPADVMSIILHKLGAIEVLSSVQKVCSSWRKICKDPMMWRVVDMRNLGDIWDMEYSLELMCAEAVDRSCGGLVDINIEYFGTDEVLHHITKSTNQLRRLRLVCCYSISDEGMTDAVSKLPLLEHLEIYFSTFAVETLEAIARYCPLLQSLTYNVQGCRDSHFEGDEDEEAIVVAENMHQLRHLRLFGNRLTNKGLEAILDGCPNLESLDLRQCFNLNLGGQLGARCNERIKNLRLPDDSTADYEFTADIAHLGDIDDCHDEDYPSSFADLDFLTDDDDYYEFSGGSDFSDYPDFYFH